MTTTLIHPQASFQARRYQRLGHGDLFANADPNRQNVAAQACDQAAASSCWNDATLPAGWEQDNADRAWRQMAWDFRHGHLLIVQPTAAQQQQIAEDGLALHQLRREILLTALDWLAADVSQEDFAAAAILSELLRHQQLVVIKTT